MLLGGFFSMTKTELPNTMNTNKSLGGNMS